jgi:hypothetical protein
LICPNTEFGFFSNGRILVKQLSGIVKKRKPEVQKVTGFDRTIDRFEKRNDQYCKQMTIIANK